MPQAQIDYVREIVADLMASELSDAATYTPPGGGSSLPCRVLITRGTEVFGDHGGAQADAITLRLANADIANQQQRGVITVVSAALGTERFRLLSRINDDGALTQWNVERV